MKALALLCPAEWALDSENEGESMRKRRRTFCVRLGDPDLPEADLDPNTPTIIGLQESDLERARALAANPTANQAGRESHGQDHTEPPRSP
jgi:hypothetical protein